MSLFDFLRQLNWVDIVILILLVRIGCVARKTGLPAESFKLLGTLVAIFVCLHYYSGLSDWLGRLLPLAKEKTPLEFLDFLCALFLAVLGYAICMLLRFAFSHFIKLEAIPVLNKWGGFLLGLIRAFLATSLVIFMLVASSVGYLRNSVNGSYFGARVFKIAPATYAGMWDGLLSKFMPESKFNNTILEVQEYIKN